MKVETFTNATEFLKACQNYLVTNEVVNSLILGNSMGLERHPERIKEKPYLLIVYDSKKISAAAVLAGAYRLVIARNEESKKDVWEALISGLLSQGIKVPGVVGPIPHADDFAQSWQKITGQAGQAGMKTRAFELKKVVFTAQIPGRMRIATESDLELVIDWVWKFESEAVGHEDIEAARETAINRILDGEIFLWEADHPVSMAAIGRPTPHGITISLVYTPPELRGRGYAISCVATLSQLQLDSGKSFCTLFTDITNPTSNEIYQRIGYKPVCDFNEYIF